MLMELVRMHLLMNTRNMVIHIVPVKNVGITRAVKIVVLQTCVASQKKKNIKINKKIEGLTAPLFLFPHVLLRKLIFFVLAYIRFLV